MGWITKFQFRTHETFNLHITYNDKNTLPTIMVSRVFFCPGLALNINAHTGFEFHGEFVLVDGDFFNQPPDKYSSPNKRDMKI